MELPFPKTRSGWFVSFVLIIFSFWFYYNYLYIKIYQVYQEQFYIPAIITEDQNWQIEMQIPKYTSLMAPGWVYGKIFNKSSEKIKFDLSIVFDGETTLLLPSIYKNEVFQRQISEEILGHSTINFRIQFGNNIVLTSNCTDYLKLMLNGKPLTIMDALPCPQDNTALDRWKAFKRAVIENFLLPPWANTLIPAFVLVFCYLAEHLKNNNDGSPLNITAIFVILVYSFFELLSFYCLIMFYLEGQYSWLVMSILGWVLLVVYSSLNQEASQPDQR